MSSPQISQVLAEMRALQARVGGVQLEAPGALSPGAINTQGPDFAQMMKDSINGVAQMQNHADALADSYESGAKNVDLTRVMLEVQKAGIAFRAMTEVRNKLIDAYNQVMNMPV
ncbi:MAG: flagellar hook-basal body complex protein FliE [Gammaproteobacteria bacterium]|nr:flagellar hook-basal body complex protein FliE [Gammaproteobacteria bacterium]MDE2348361.1 flagellar hook-basal body complex protein FliE [Gammaproteobacteria bacterium]